MSSDSDYRLSAVLLGHSSDVRGLSVTESDSIVSCSRDKTVKLWRSVSFNSGYTENMCFDNHSGYVTCVLALNSSVKYPNGLILTGGMDKEIYVFSPGDISPLRKLTGHTDTVCDLSEGVEANSFISSSWDNSAKLWSLTEAISLTQNYNGHKMAVWSAVQQSNTNVITGSADKTIIIWSKSGNKISLLEGHLDCVRKIRILNDSSFVSVSNDASIKFWKNDGECLETLYGHTNFIYDVCIKQEADGYKIVTCGEDRTIRIWKGGQNIQVLFMPAQSVWSVKFLNNGDIVAATSDGAIRIFTNNADRVADLSTLNSFEDNVQTMNAATMGTIGGYKISDLPGPEAIMEPGKNDGQTKIIRENTTLICYQWSSSKMLWEKVGDVLGASGGSNEASGKTLYEGKEYDYVFSIDVEDGKPPLKLPYNRNQDPWVVAQEFLNKYDLPQVYLDQVSNFITKNSKAENQVILNNYADPYTGTNRYVPDGSVQPPAHIEQYIPQKSFIKFDQLNLNGLQMKLKEFAKIFNNDDHDVDLILKLVDGDCSKSQDNLILNFLETWSEDKQFPLLDVLRSSVRFEETNKRFANDTNGPILMSVLTKYLKISYNFPTNTNLALKILSNFVLYESGQKLVFSNLIQLGDLLIGLTSITQNKNIQITLSTLLLNLTIASVKSDYNQIQETVAKILGKCFNHNLNESGAEFRCLVAFGTLLVGIKNSNHRPQLIKAVRSMNNFNEKIQKILNDEGQKDVLTKKRNDCAKQLVDFCNQN